MRQTSLSAKLVSIGGYQVHENPERRCIERFCADSSGVWKDGGAPHALF